MHLQARLRSFWRSCSQKSGLNIWASISTQWYENTPGYDTESIKTLKSSYRYVMIMHWYVFEILM